MADDASRSMRVFETRLAMRVAEHLQRTFGARFTVWRRTGAWRPIGSDVISGSGLDTSRFPQLLDEVWEQKRQAQLVEFGQGRSVLVLPLDLGNDSPTVGVAECPDMSSNTSDLLLRLAESYLHEEGIRGELKRLQLEIEQFAVQVTQDFEELTFLRNVADHLQICNASSNLATLAEEVLPTLNQSLQAQLLVLAVKKKTTGSAASTACEFYREGDEAPGNDQVLQLIEAYDELAAVQPVVRNYKADGRGRAAGDPFRSFVLVRVATEHECFGWLVALNRRAAITESPATGGQQAWAEEFGTGEATLLHSAASILAAHASNVQLLQEREALLVNMVRALVTSIEAKDEYTRGHSDRVALFGRRLAEEIGFDGDACERIYLSGLLHDVGKIGISDATLRKPGRLTEEEFAEIKMHPDKGWGILHDLKQLAYVLPGVLYHHERFDGRGYPDGLAGERIPIDGRILAVADAYDAMTSDRPYRRGMPQEKAEAILRQGAGTQWDPKLIEAFFRAMPDIIAIRKSYRPRPYPTRRRADTNEPVVCSSLGVPLPLDAGTGSASPSTSTEAS